MNDIIKMIDLYFDKELDKSKETLLFTLLSTNEEAREYFKKANLLNMAVKESVKEFPSRLEERIFQRISNHEDKSLNTLFRKNIFTVVSYAVTVLMIAAALFFYSRNVTYKEKLENVSAQASKQEKLINLLYNSITTTEIQSTIDYKVIVSDNL